MAKSKANMQHIHVNDRNISICEQFERNRKYRSSIIDLCDVCLSKVRMYRNRLRHRSTGKKLVCKRCYNKLKNKKDYSKLYMMGQVLRFIHNSKTK